MANSDHQHATPFDDDNETEPLPEELRQVARRYATLQVPRPTSEETNRLIARLQISTSARLAPAPTARERVQTDSHASNNPNSGWFSQQSNTGRAGQLTSDYPHDRCHHGLGFDEHQRAVHNKWMERLEGCHPP